MGNAVGVAVAADAVVGVGSAARVLCGVGIGVGSGAGAGWTHPVAARRAKRVKSRSHLQAFLPLKGAATGFRNKKLRHRTLGHLRVLAKPKQTQQDKRCHCEPSKANPSLLSSDN